MNKKILVVLVKQHGFCQPLPMSLRDVIECTSVTPQRCVAAASPPHFERQHTVECTQHHVFMIAADEHHATSLTQPQ